MTTTGALLLPMVSFEQVWRDEFEPMAKAAAQKESELRTEAFLDVPLTLCGEPVRQMTPADLVILDALANPFVAGLENGEAGELDCAGFIWQLHVDNNRTSSLGNLFRRAKLIRRLARLTVAEKCVEIAGYCNRMFLDLRSSDEGEGIGDELGNAPPPTYFLAPMLTSLCAEMGHIDPMSGAILADTPIPRLLQYSKSIRRQQSGENEYSQFHSLRSQCLSVVNERNAELRRLAATN